MFLMMVQVLATIHTASVTSWIRTPARNKRVGGGEASRHLVGMACDLVCDNPENNADLIKHARALGLDAVNEGDHIHIEADKRTD